MKQIKIYGLEGCNLCREVTNEIDNLVSGKDIKLVKKFCGAIDSECDELEDRLNTRKYPILVLNGFDYFKDKFNIPNGIVYICNNYNETYTPVMFSNDTVGVGVVHSESMVEKIKQIV